MKTNRILSLSTLAALSATALTMMAPAGFAATHATKSVSSKHVTKTRAQRKNAPVKAGYGPKEARKVRSSKKRRSHSKVDPVIEPAQASNVDSSLTPAT